MPVLKGALHTHTTCSDGQLTPDELVDVYRGLGFQFVAITDHDHLLRPDYWESLPHGDTDFLVFPGVELTVFERGYVHVGEIRGERETLRIFNHPAEYDLPFEKLLDVLSSVCAADSPGLRRGVEKRVLHTPVRRGRNPLSQDRLGRRPYAGDVRTFLGDHRLPARQRHDPPRDPRGAGHELGTRPGDQFVHGQTLKFLVHGRLFWLFWGVKKGDFFGLHPKKVLLNKSLTRVASAALGNARFPKLRDEAGLRSAEENDPMLPGENGPLATESKERLFLGPPQKTLSDARALEKRSGTTRHFLLQSG